MMKKIKHFKERKDMAETKNVAKKNNGKKATVKKYTKPAVDFSNVRAGGTYEYKMSKECAYNILHDPLNGKKMPGDDAVNLCNYVNEQYGLLGTCVSVLVG